MPSSIATGRLAEPDKHLEAITSRLLLLSAIAQGNAPTNFTMVSVKYGKDLAKPVMRRRSVAEGKKTPERIRLLFAKQRDVRERLRACQHRHEADKQHFAQGIDNLPLLPGIE